MTSIEFPAILNSPQLKTYPHLVRSDAEKLSSLEKI